MVWSSGDIAFTKFWTSVVYSARNLSVASLLDWINGKPLTKRLVNASNPSILAWVIPAALSSAFDCSSGNRSCTFAKCKYVLISCSLECTSVDWFMGENRNSLEINQKFYGSNFKINYLMVFLVGITCDWTETYSENFRIRSTIIKTGQLFKSLYKVYKKTNQLDMWLELELRMHKRRRRQEGCWEDGTCWKNEFWYFLLKIISFL